MVHLGTSVTNWPTGKQTGRMLSFARHSNILTHLPGGKGGKQTFFHEATSSSAQWFGPPLLFQRYCAVVFRYRSSIHEWEIFHSSRLSTEEYLPSVWYMSRWDGEEKTHGAWLTAASASGKSNCLESLETANSCTRRSRFGENILYTFPNLLNVLSVSCSGGGWNHATKQIIEQSYHF